MRKALLIAAVAVVAATGAIVGVIVSSGGGDSAGPGTSAASGSTGSTQTGPGGTSGRTTTGSTSTGPTVNPLVPTTTAAIPPPPGPGSPRLRSFMIGTVDDALAQRNPASARAQVDLSHRAGFDAVVISAAWQRGRTAPASGTLHGIRNAGAAAKRDHMRFFLVSWHGFARETPHDGAQRQQFADFTAALVKAPGAAIAP